jgi:hypothetical protein
MIANKQRWLVGAVGMLAFTITGICSTALRAQNDKQGPSGNLNNEQNALLRRLVYKGVQTTVPIDGPGIGKRHVVLPDEMIDIYKKKRGKTLALLLDVVKGARPEDVLAAASYALALEGEIVAALICYDCDPADVDRISKKHSTTYRERLASAISGMISVSKN